MYSFVRISCCIIASAAAIGAAHATDNRAPPPARALNSAGQDDESIQRYWTPERMLNAKPMDLRATGTPPRSQHRAAVPGVTRIVPGGLPTVPYNSELSVKLYDPALRPQHAPPPLSGTGGKPYTTNRLFPDPVSLRKIYPYSTIGQLFFVGEGGGNFVCTASVIRYNTIATAGHCVADGNQHYWSKWLFAPGENNGIAPLGKWTYTAAQTTSAWYYGGGGVPNEQDDAVIVLHTRKVGGVVHHIGDLTGWLGYETNAPAPIAITQIGYPCNLDSCSRPIATYAQNNAAGTNNFEWGTAQGGGSSGGPQIQDFGQAPSGIPSELFGGNILVSSTSYGYTDSAIQVQGGSVLYNAGQNGEYTFGDALAYACSVGGC